MSYRTIITALTLSATALLGALPAVSQAEVEMAVSGNNERAVSERFTAVITAIDYKTRKLTLEGPLGDAITLTAGDELKRFDEFAKGDHVVATYAASISGELRVPTAAELEQPWVELDAAGVAEAHMDPGAAAGRIIRAVCTIEGMNRITGTVTVQDPNGNLHVIGDVPAEKMAGVKLGDTIVITYSEAMALELEKQGAAK